MIRPQTSSISMDSLKKPFLSFVVFLMVLAAFKKVGSLLIFSSDSEQPTAYSYEMVRPPEEKRRKSLLDFQVVERSHHWQAPNDRIPMSKDGVKKVGDGKAAPPAKNNIAAENLKKAQKAAAAAAALKKQLAERRKAKVAVDVVQSEEEKSDSEVSNFPEVVSYEGRKAPTRQLDPVQENEEKEKAKNRLSLSEWKSLVSNTPSKANIDKLLAAKRARQIRLDEYYAVVKELVISGAEDRQRAGIYALQKDVSAETFEFMVTVRAQALNTVQGQIQTLITKYSEPSQLDELSRVVIASKNPTVVLEAMKGVMASVQAWKQQKENTSQGGARNPAYTARFEQDLKSLLPSLRRVSSRSQSDISGMALEIMNQIESGSQTT